VQVGPGSTLASRYRLVRLIGRGGMAEVYEAIDGRLGRRVAVKVFRGETDIATSEPRPADESDDAEVGEEDVDSSCQPGRC
jgi:hypothetical protein